MTEQELYQQYLKETGQAQPSDDELYQQYLQETGQTAPAEKVVNEMHPDIDFTTRAVYKNFGGDPEASFNYLQKKQPNLQWKKNKSGEVLAKRPEESEWRRLDPRGFDLQDITDVGYDIPAAVAQGAATAAAGLAGGIAGGGLGAIPAAMGASAASGAGLETVRQGLGSLMGIEDNLSGTDIGVAAVAGGASPLLFGTGAGAKEAVKTIGREGAQKLLESQRGLLGRAYDATTGYIGPKLGALVSGENAKVISKAAEILPEIKAADTNPEIRSLPLKEVAQNVPRKLKEITTATGQKLEDLRALIDAPEVVTERGLTVPGPSNFLPGAGGTPTQTVKGSIPSAEFIKPFEELAIKLTAGGAPTDAQLKDLKTLRKILESEFKGLPENLTAAQVDTLRKRFKERAEQFGLNYGKTGQAVGGTEGASAIDAQIAMAFEDSRKNMMNAIINKLEQLNPKYAEEYASLNDQYSFLKNVAKENNTKFKTSKSVSDFLGRATKDDLEAQNLLDIQSVTGVDLEDLAVRDQALRVFSKPSTEIRSLGGTTSTTRSVPLAVAGGTAGYYLGQQSGGDFSPFLAAVLGGGLGSKVGSPAAMRKYMEANQLLRQAPQQLPGYKYLPYLMMNPNLNDQGE